MCLQLLKCRRRRPWYNNKQAALSSSGRGATFEPWWGNTLVGSTPSAAGSVACIVRHTARQYCPQVVRGAQFEPACPNTASVFDSLYTVATFLLMSSQQRFQHRSYSVWAVALGSFTRVLPPRHGGRSRMNRRLQPTNKQGPFRGCCKRRLSCCAMTASIIHEAYDHACCALYHSLTRVLTHAQGQQKCSDSTVNRTLKPC